jgi:LuxR family maltose regulon positive regulatory protein
MACRAPLSRLNAPSDSCQMQVWIVSQMASVTLGCALQENVSCKETRRYPFPITVEAPRLLESWREKEVRILALASTALANHRPHDALVELTSLVSVSEQGGLLRTKLRALLVRQVVNDRLSKGAAATKDFQAALEIGAATGIRQAFFEFDADTVRKRVAAGVPERFLDFINSLEGIPNTCPSDRPDNALTRRERQILEILTSGESDKGIARQFQVTEYAVRFHLKNIYRKLGVHDRYSAISLRPL